MSNQLSLDGRKIDKPYPTLEEATRTQKISRLKERLSEASRERDNYNRAIERLTHSLAVLGVRRCAVKNWDFCDEPRCGVTQPPFTCVDEDALVECEDCGDKFPEEMLIEGDDTIKRCPGCQEERC